MRGRLLLFLAVLLLTPTFLAAPARASQQTITISGPATGSPTLSPSTKSITAGDAVVFDNGTAVDYLVCVQSTNDTLAYAPGHAVSNPTSPITSGPVHYYLARNGCDVSATQEATGTIEVAPTPGPTTTTAPAPPTTAPSVATTAPSEAGPDDATRAGGAPARVATTTTSAPGSSTTSSTASTTTTSTTRPTTTSSTPATVRADGGGGGDSGWGVALAALGGAGAIAVAGLYFSSYLHRTRASNADPLESETPEGPL